MTFKPDLAGMDPSRIPDHCWEFEGYSADGMRRHYIFWVDRENGVAFRKTENITEVDLLEMNQEEFKDSQTKRFGDMPKVASIPLNRFYSDFSSRLKEGDKDYVKWWLNNDENKPFRTFRGKF